MEKDYIQQTSDIGEKNKHNDSILSYLAQNNNNELHELKSEIISCQKEIEVLKAEIEILEHVDNQTDLFMNYAQDHSKRVADNIDNMINQEIVKIKDVASSISDNHQLKIEELDTKMQKGIQYAYKIMNDMLEKQNHIDVPTVKKEDEYKEKKPEPKSEDLKIIEGFWEGNEIEEKTVIKTNKPAQDNVSVLKNMYIIGKAAGDDLFDKSGKLIIAKNETIIQEVIDKAEREGKLIELVLEMKLQEG